MQWQVRPTLRKTHSQDQAILYFYTLYGATSNRSQLSRVILCCWRWASFLSIFFSKCHITKLNGSSILECCLGIELIRPTKIFQQQHSPQNSAADRPWGKNSPVIVISFHHRGRGTALLFDCSLNGLWLGRFNECLGNRNKTCYLNDSTRTMTRLQYS